MTKTAFLVTAALTAFGGSTSAASWTDVNLNANAVKDGSGAIQALGTTGTYSTGKTRETVFDGDPATFFDAKDTHAWVGYELTRPMCVTRVRYLGRASSWGQYNTRMVGMLVQGANSADFSDAVTLHAIAPTESWLKANQAWGDESFSSLEMTNAFRYVRLYTPNTSGEYGTGCGNAAEIEFYGCDPAALPASGAPADPATVFQTTINGVFNLQWTAAADAMLYQVQRKQAGDAAFTDIFTGRPSGDVKMAFKDLPVVRDTQFRYRAVNPLGASAWQTFDAARLNYLRGTVIGFGSAASGKTRDVAFDGDVTTFVDPSADGHGAYVGLDLGTERTISRIRFVPRTGYPERMVNGIFQVARYSDFSDAVTVHTVATKPSAGVVTDVSVTKTTGRYVRFKAPSGVWCNVSEIEFIASGIDAPTSVTVSSGSLTDSSVTVSWTVPPTSTYTASYVYRATAPGGPWTPMTPDGLDSGTLTWTDENLEIGVLYWYSVAVGDGTLTSDIPDSTASFRRCRELERSAADKTQLLPGCAAFESTSGWHGNPATYAFDGDTSTYPDYLPTNSLFGIDFGTLANTLCFVRVYPRANRLDRSTGAQVFAANAKPSYSDDWNTTATALTAPIAMTAAQYYEVSAESAVPYRYYFIAKNGDYCSNISELELWGYGSDDPGALQLQAPSAITLNPTAAGVEISWNAARNATGYRVERRMGNEETWTAVSGTLTSTGFTDNSHVCDGSLFRYRIVAVRDAETAFSATVSRRCYVPGSGTGLHAVYRKSYVPNATADETVAWVTTNATVNFDWGDGPLVPGDSDTADNVGVCWSGRLIVPFEGDYALAVTSDNGATLTVDDAAVITTKASATCSEAKTVHLTAGEHPIRLDYVETTGPASCALSWGGCIDEGPIPASQLKPEPVVLPEPWISERTMGDCPRGRASFTDTGFTLTHNSAGSDFYGSSECCEMLAARQEGDFTATLRFASDGTANVVALLQIRSGLNFGANLWAPAARPGQKDVSVKGRLGSGGVADVVGWKSGALKAASGWLRVRRTGKDFKAYYRTTDTDAWTEFASFADTNGLFEKTIYICPSVASPSGVERAIDFTNLTIRPVRGLMIFLK